MNLEHCLGMSWSVLVCLGSAGFLILCFFQVDPVGITAGASLWEIKYESIQMLSNADADFHV